MSADADAHVSACPSCAEAQSNPLTGLYHNGCHDCEARALANTPGFAASLAMGKFRADYVEALRAFAGNDTAAREELHRRVREWGRRLHGLAP